MKKILMIIVAMVALAALHSCKTTEANYRAAYTIAKEKQMDGGDSTVTAALRDREMPQTMVIGGVAMPVRTERVIYSKKQANPPEQLKVYNVVAGKFKQLFNAESLCARVREAGFNAFIVYNSDLTYYIVAETTQSPREAADVLDKLRATTDIHFQDTFPYVLRAAQLVR